MRSRSGFTLIELLVVVAIIGILAAIATVNFQNYLRRAKFTETKSLIAEMATTIETIKIDEQRYPASYDLYALGRKLTETGKSRLNLQARSVQLRANGDDPYGVDQYGNVDSSRSNLKSILSDTIGADYNKKVIVQLENNDTDGDGPIIVDSWGTPIFYISSSTYCPSNRCNTDPKFGTTRPAAYKMKYDANRQPTVRDKPHNSGSFQLMSFGPDLNTSDFKGSDSCGIGCLLWDDDLDNDGDGKKDIGDSEVPAEDDVGNF